MLGSRKALISALFGITASLGWAAVGWAADGPPQPSFGLPIDCQPGATCWIAQYVDLDPGPGLKDYNCGTTTSRGFSSIYNGNEGTVFAIQDKEAMRQGVPVLAAAPGRVIAVRDGMEDISLTKLGGFAALKGRGCGNRVGISHGRGWVTDYCHLRKGSLKVKEGDRVEAGQRIAMVGMSGATEYPHLHFAVYYGNEVIGPFVGRGRKAECGLGERPLWKKEVLTRLPYQASAIFNAGFADTKPEIEEVRDGQYRSIPISPKSPAFVVWAETLHPLAGDVLEMRIRGPDGWVFYENRRVCDKTEARRWDFAGKKNKSGAWAPGPYTATFRLIRENGPRGHEEFSTTRQIRIRKQR